MATGTPGFIQRILANAVPSGPGPFRVVLHAGYTAPPPPIQWALFAETDPARFIREAAARSEPGDDGRAVDEAYAAGGMIPQPRQGDAYPPDIADYVYGEATALIRKLGPLDSLDDGLQLTVAGGPGQYYEAWTHHSLGVWYARAGEPTENLSAEDMTVAELRAMLDGRA